MSIPTEGDFIAGMIGELQMETFLIAAVQIGGLDACIEALTKVRDELRAGRPVVDTEMRKILVLAYRRIQYWQGKEPNEIADVEELNKIWRTPAPRKRRKKERPPNA